MTKEKMIQTAVDHVAYLRELESLNNWIVEVTDYMNRATDMEQKAGYCRTLVDLRTQRQELIESHAV